MKCKDCKYSVTGKVKMWCARHAPVVIANPRWDVQRDQSVSLTIQPEVAPNLTCGDFEEKK